MNIINLTPHTINILNENGEEVISLPPSGQIARITTEKVKASEVDGIPLFFTRLGVPEGLPEMEPGTIYIVSGLFRQYVPGRIDVYQPGELKRDENGNVIGCIGLSQ